MGAERVRFSLRNCAQLSQFDSDPIPSGIFVDPYLHNLILELGQEEVDDLELLDGQREQVNLLHRPDLAVLHETAELGDGDPAGRARVGMGRG